LGEEDDWRCRFWRRWEGFKEEGAAEVTEMLEEDMLREWRFVQIVVGICTSRADIGNPMIGMGWSGRDEEQARDDRTYSFGSIGKEQAE
jgi:hypothetical protein